MNSEVILNNLSKSKFRSSFKLKDIDIKYVKDKGMDTIKRHAYDFITKRLAPKDKQLSQEEIDYVVNIIMKWINREINSK